MLATVLVTLSMLNSYGEAAKIFYISAAPSLSHSIWNQKLAKLLIDRNHQVTMLGVGRKAFNHTNFEYHYLYLQKYTDYFDMEQVSRSSSSAIQMEFLFQFMKTTCKELLYLPQTKTFLNKYRIQKLPFDLIINDGACCESFLGFVKILGSPPLILTTPFSTSTYLLEYAGLYDNPAYVPQAFSALPQNMNFSGRIENFYLYLKMYFNYHLSYIKKQNEMAKTFFEDDSIDIIEIARNSKITLINTHPVLDGVKPHLPNIATIGGFHIDKPKPLEKYLQTLLDNASNGVIYFSIGSNLNCESMKQDKIDLFIKVFKDLKINVLWKCGMNVTNLPSNIKLGKWFQQNDILAHPNVKVFITHGGLLSTQEAIYHGVPMLVLPFIGDQHVISQKLERMGIAVRLIYAELTTELLQNSLTKLLTDKRYQERMREVSLLFRDNPVSPRNLTTFWIEYVLRHPGTNILRSPTQNMSFYQLIMLDIIVLFTTICTVIVITAYLIIKHIIKVFNPNKKKDKVN